MKSKAKQASFCSRCGDQIPTDELRFLKNTTVCALCSNTQLECLEIYQASIRKSRPHLTLLTQNIKKQNGSAA